MKFFIFILVLVMPNGEPVLESRLVQECPDVTATDNHFQKMYEEGKILRWGATCFQFQERGQRL